MAKGKRNKGKGKGRGGSTNTKPAEHDLAAQVAPLVAEIAAADEAAAGPLWGQTHRLLLKSKMDHASLAAIVARRDVEALSRAVEALSRDATEEASAALEPAQTPDAAPPAEFDAEVLKKALRAFRKRLKLTRLDHESKLGVGPMTSGRDCGIRAIMPPRDFDEGVWESLVRQGKLRKAGPGFYEVIDE